jgi:hypothetical protein
MGKSSSPNAPSTWLISLCPPYSRSPTELASILLLAFSLFVLSCHIISVWVQKVLIYQLNFTILMLYEYHIIYSIWYHQRFHITTVGLAMYYLWIQGDTPEPNTKCICAKFQPLAQHLHWNSNVYFMQPSRFTTIPTSIKNKSSGSSILFLQDLPPH